MRELTSRAKLKSVAFIADLEKGYRNPSPEVLANLAIGLGVPLDDLRSHDRRAPLHEIAALTEKDPTWAPAFRAIVDAANGGKLTPKKLHKLLETPATTDSSQQPLFNL